MKKVSLKKGVSLKKKNIVPNQELVEPIMDSAVSIPLSNEHSVSLNSGEEVRTSDESRDTNSNENQPDELDDLLPDESGVFLRTLDGLEVSDLDSLDIVYEDEKARSLKDESGVFLRTLDGLESILFGSDDTEASIENSSHGENFNQETDFWDDASSEPNPLKKQTQSSKSYLWIGLFLLVLVGVGTLFLTQEDKRIWLRSNLGFHSEVDLVCVQPKTFEVNRKNLFDEDVSFDVSLSPFAISKTEVTRELWFEVMGYKPWESSECAEGYTKQKDVQLPATCVSWFEAVVFMNALSLKNDLTPYYIFTIDNPAPAKKELSWQEKVQHLNHSSIKRTSGGNGYRLPTDVEWEYAAKADESTQYAGGNRPGTVAWFVGNSETKTKLKPVAQKDANAFGIFDMSGGVYEWVWDWKADYPRDSKTLTNPTGTLNRSNKKLVRGGSILSNKESLETTAFDTQFPDTINFVTGFRLVQHECQLQKN